MTCTIIYRPKDGPEVTLTYPAEREMEIIECARKACGGPAFEDEALRYARAVERQKGER